MPDRPSLPAARHRGLAEEWYCRCRVLRPASMQACVKCGMLAPHLEVGQTPEGQPEPPLDGTTYQGDHTPPVDYLILYDEAGVVIDVVHEIPPGEDWTVWFTRELPCVSKIEFKRGRP